MQTQRRAGACLHLSSLPGEYGIGELGENARSFVDTLASMGFGVWQFLPLGPVGHADSPYQSPSTYAGNPLLIDLETLRDQGLVDELELSPFRVLPRGRVDFPALIPLKLGLLARAGARFEMAASPQWRQARDEFVAVQGPLWLDDYARFEALKTRYRQRPWTEWDAPHARRDPDALQALEIEARAQLRSIRSVQFLFFQQWRELREYAHARGVRLMGDLPIYVALDSADVWAHPDLFQLDENCRPTGVAGVPPDYFSEDGQRWDNPLYDWDRHAADGYRWWVARVRHAAALADLVRLDHFRGLESYWAIPPDTQTARHGEWRPGPAGRLLDALGDALGELPIIAEDLGIIPPEVGALRDRYGLAGMKVLQFMLTEERFDPEWIPEHSVCYTGTHDNDTTAGWFHNELGETPPLQSHVLRHVQGCPETIHRDLVRFAFSSRARLAVAPVQDLLGLGSQARMNTPGTTGGNWHWRLEPGQLTPELCAWVGQALEDAGRGGGSFPESKPPNPL